MVVESNVKKVQHPTGGIVGEIRVRDGDRVKAGDLVMRLDETITRANLGIVTSQLDELAVRQARLKAERDGADELELPAELAARGQRTRGRPRNFAGETHAVRKPPWRRDGQKAQLQRAHQSARPRRSGGSKPSSGQGAARSS